jgi:hypothetical protein
MLMRDARSRICAGVTGSSISIEHGISPHTREMPLDRRQVFAYRVKVAVVPRQLVQHALSHGSQQFEA